MDESMRETRNRQRGSATLIAVLGMFLLSGIGISSVSMVATGEAARISTMAANQAYDIAQAGVEFAKNRIDMGINPSVQNVPFGNGSFSITSNPVSGAIYVQGQVAAMDGVARKTFGLTTNFAKDCVSLDLTNAHSASSSLEALKINKSCLSTATINDWTISWTPDQQERVVKVQVQGQQLYDDQVGKPSGEVLGASPYTMNNNSVYAINKIEFDDEIQAGKTYTITLQMSDGSLVTGSFVDPGDSNDGEDEAENDDGEDGNGEVEDENDGEDEDDGESEAEEDDDNDESADDDASDDTPGYEIEDNGDIVVSAQKTITVDALCAEITYGLGGPPMTVKAWLGIDKDYSTALFNGAKIKGGETTTITSDDDGATYTIKAMAKYKKEGKLYFKATYNSNNVLQVKTLTNGQQAPPLAGFGGQKPISACIANFIDEQGIVQLQSNQVLLLFELGVDMDENPGSLAADFQDFVGLMTIN